MIAVTDAPPKLAVMTQLALPDDKLIRLRTPRDVLATVPRLLGYRPNRSVVLLNVHDGNTTSTMRVDLPGLAGRPAEKRFITSLVGMLCKVPGVRKTLIVVYVDEPFDGADDLPRAAFVRSLIDRLDASGFRVHDALCVAADAWGSYGGPEAGIAHRLDELDEAAPGSAGCGQAADNVDELAVISPASLFERRAFDEALDRCLRRPGAPGPVEAAEAALALDTATADSDQLAVVLAALLDAESRDAVLFTWAWGIRRGRELLAEIELIAAGEVGPGDDSIALDLMGMGRAARPDPGQVAHAIELMSRVAALAPDDVGHIPLTVLGWLHWSRGHASIAARFIGRARELDPAYGLAELLDLALGRGLLANWVFVDPAD